MCEGWGGEGGVIEGGDSAEHTGEERVAAGGILRYISHENAPALAWGPHDASTSSVVPSPYTMVTDPVFLRRAGRRARAASTSFDFSVCLSPAGCMGRVCECVSGCVGVGGLQ